MAIPSSDPPMARSFTFKGAFYLLSRPSSRRCLPSPSPIQRRACLLLTYMKTRAPLTELFAFFYPATQPTVATLNELQETIEILVGKYDMQSIVPMAKTHLQKYLESQPLAVYAVAFAQRWEDVGRDAAKECLKLPLRIPDPEVPRELRHLTSTAYHNLLLYHFQCAEAVKQTTKDLKWIQNPARYCWFICGSCAAHGSVLLSDGTAPSVRSWFMQFLNGMGEQLALKPIRSLCGHPLFFDAIRVAVYCNGHCRARALDDLNSFITVWEAKITEEIGKVEWKF
ncbi:hypothetical protein MSAN_02016300 [Mycena sanguinolenta]|uniref:Uncharacterized protein n=1 Tax=Mycena sanguinolenta TaxID=230812 RepID=A0A8H7CNK4_9AGAR|nr:hypothetical protein MSAN_02016300 [Mycena sanguinolenta]